MSMSNIRRGLFLFFIFTVFIVSVVECANGHTRSTSMGKDESEEAKAQEKKDAKGQRPMGVPGGEELPADQEEMLARAGLGGDTELSGPTYSGTNGGAGTSRNAGRFQVLPPMETLRFAGYPQQGQVDHRFWGANFYENYQQFHIRTQGTVPEYWIGAYAYSSYAWCLRLVLALCAHSWCSRLMLALGVRSWCSLLVLPLCACPFSSGLGACS
jgi:hypothetical protein